MADEGTNDSLRHPPVGRLWVYVWHGGIEEGDRHLLDFTGSDWDALFHDVLKAAEPPPYLTTQSVDENDAREREMFQQSISEYPMLGRIWDLYVDASYEAGEVKLLQDECLKIRSNTEHAGALQALGKLLLSCNEALNDGAGLFLVSD